MERDYKLKICVMFYRQMISPQYGLCNKMLLRCVQSLTILIKVYFSSWLTVKEYGCYNLT